jgi:hypothetical protein
MEVVMHGIARLPAVLLIVVCGSPAFAGEANVRLTEIAFRPNAAEAIPQSWPVVPVAGSECPTGGGSYCSDSLPYCCPGINVAAYCAADVNGCTQ